MTTTINAVSGTGLTQTSDGSGIVKLQSNGVTTNALAWVNWVGTTGAIRSSYNVSSVTRTSTGYYTVTFATPMADANYAIAAGGGEGGTTGMGQRVPSVGTVSTTSVVIACINQDASYVDGTYCCLTIFGN